LKVKLDIISLNDRRRTYNTDEVRYVLEGKDDLREDDKIL